MTDSRVDYGNLWDISQHHNLTVTNVERNLRSAGCESEESPLSFGNRPHHSSGQIGILCNLCIRLAKKTQLEILGHLLLIPTNQNRTFRKRRHQRVICYAGRGRHGPKACQFMFKRI